MLPMVAVENAVEKQSDDFKALLNAIQLDDARQNVKTDEITVMIGARPLKPSQHISVGPTLVQHYGIALKQRWSNVQNETKPDVGFSMLHKVDTTSVAEVETTMKQRCTALFQRSFNVN